MKPCFRFLFPVMFLFSVLHCTPATTIPTEYRSVIIGDSMFWSGMPFFGGEPSPLSKWLETWAQHPIENHALVGASLEDGWIKSIRAQFQDLVFSPPITTLIMDGGGNDVISHRKACEAMTQECTQTIDTAITIAKDIWSQAAQKNIRHVLYLGFYDIPGLDAAADLANPLMQQACASAPLDCHFIDPRYRNDTEHSHGLKIPEMLGPDNLHPTQEGYKVLAELIWNTKTFYNITI